MSLVLYLFFPVLGQIDTLVFQPPKITFSGTQGQRRLPRKERHDIFAQGWSTEPIQPSRYKVRPDLKDLTSWWCNG